MLRYSHNYKIKFFNIQFANVQKKIELKQSNYKNIFNINYEL